MAVLLDSIDDRFFEIYGNNLGLIEGQPGVGEVCIGGAFLMPVGEDPRKLQVGCPVDEAGVLVYYIPCRKVREVPREISLDVLPLPPEFQGVRVYYAESGYSAQK